MKKAKLAIVWFLVFMVLFSAGSMIRGGIERNKEWVNPYLDVNESLWSYQYITELSKAGVLPEVDQFNPTTEETRGNLVLYLYNLDSGAFKKREKLEPVEEKDSPDFGEDFKKMVKDAGQNMQNAVDSLK